MVNVSSETPLLQQSLADIVTHDVRTAAVFDRAGLDYCCHGHHTLEDAAAERDLPIAGLLAALEALGPLGAEHNAGERWSSLDELTAHIVTQHHGYVRQTTPLIAAWLDKLVARHGERHPELKEVQTTFATLATDMTTHMIKEENILFPYVDALAAARRAGSRLPPSPFGTVLNPIRLMEEDHQHAGDALTRLRELTGGYTTPEDGCTTYRLCYQELARYEADLHRHVHLENSILFPRAAELEQGLA